MKTFKESGGLIFIHESTTGVDCVLLVILITHRPEVLSIRLKFGR